MRTNGWNAAQAVEWVRTRGVAPAGKLTERPLMGGVSSTVIAVDGTTDGVVVKRALEVLRVDSEWRADPRRSLTEAHALAVLGGLTPNRVPKLLDVDPSSCTLVMERAPIEAENWRSAILDRPASPSVGAELGTTLAAWHRGTWMPWAGAGDFEAGAVLEQLRLRPFHAAVAAVFPDLADQVLACAADLRRARLCLVHGDLSPKNVLIGKDLLWVIDPEVAHIGDPVFDVAFMAAHLILTAIARPAFATTLGDTWLAFLEGYLADAPPASIRDRLNAQVGCLLLARTDGVSREPGLTLGARDQVRRVGRTLLGGSGGEADTMWGIVADVVG
jgi:tRNA A-37 threonylcarbamoyl transferase component Bud32